LQRLLVKTEQVLKTHPGSAGVFFVFINLIAKSAPELRVSEGHRGYYHG
jgi:hypothetical protein